MITHLDIIGALFAFLATIAYIRVNPLAWPLGLIAISIDIFLYWKKGIYGDMTLQAVYIMMTFYGWYMWMFGGQNRTTLEVTSISPLLAKQLTIISTISIALLFVFLKQFTNSQIPLLDAITTVLSLIAQWLICRKIIQCWILWFFIDALYSVIYIYKGIPAHALLQIIYLGMAITGYLSWRSQAQNHCGAISLK